MWLIPHGVPPLDPRLQTELFKGIGHELSTLIILQSLDLVSCCQFNVCLECLESIQSMGLGLEKVDAPEACCNINKDAEVLVTFWRLSWHWTMEISMNEFQGNGVGSCCPVHNPPLVTRNAGFTDWIRFGRSNDNKVINQIE